MDANRLAINSVSTRQDDLEEIVAAYAAAGFPNVEFNTPVVWEYLDDGHEVADVRALLEDHGLDCVGGFEGVATLFGDDVAGDNEDVLANAELLSDLGAGTLVVGTDGPEGADDLDTDALLDAYAERFAELGDHLAGTDVTVCIEFNWSPVLQSLWSAAAVARRSGRENVGVLFDPAHYHCTPTKPAELTAENVAQVAHVHVDDMAHKPGELSHCNDDRVLPGEGCLDLPDLFGRLEEHGYDGHFSVELFDDDLRARDPEDAAREMRESLDYLV